MANIPGTNVPAVVFGNDGFQAPSGPAVLAGVQTDINGAFGRTLNYQLTTPQGQIASTQAALIVNTNSIFVYYTNQTNPDFAVGRMQDAIGNIYFINRLPSIPTILQVLCSGQGVTIAVNAPIQDTSGNVYVCTEAGTIPAGGGSITLPFANLVPGPIPVPSTNAISIYQVQPGWDSVSVSSGVVGRDVETPAEFEQRRKETVAGNSFGAIGSIIGAVASKVPNVVDYFGYDNASAAPVTIAGVSIAANTIFISVAGGTDLAVAQAILSKKGPGCGYTGNTTVTAYDSNPLYSAPQPYSVTFERPAALQVIFAVSIVNGPLVPSDAATQIQNAIVSAFSGADNGPRARIAGLILASRFISPVAVLGSWAQIRSLLIGSANTAIATFTGAIAGTALTASSISGTIAVGQTVLDATGNIAAGTTIVSGSGSSWVVSISQTVSSEAMSSALPNQTSVQVKGSQLPEVNPNNIAVTIS